MFSSANYTGIFSAVVFGEGKIWVWKNLVIQKYLEYCGVVQKMKSVMSSAFASPFQNRSA